MRASLDALTAHIAVLDGDGRILATNKAWRRFAVRNELAWEETRDAANYLEVCDRAAAAGDASAATSASLIRRVIAGRSRECSFEYPCHSPREQRWFLCRVTRFPGRGLVRVVVAHENITARKVAEEAAVRARAELERRVEERTADLVRANEALRASEERFAHAVDAATDGLWDWNIKTGEVYFSPQWIRLLGYSPDEVPPSVEFWKSILHPDDVARVKEALRAHFEGRTEIYECENRLRMKSGEYRWNLDRGKVVEWDEHGAPLRMVGTDADITERKRMENEVLQTSEAERQRVAADLHDGICQELIGISFVASAVQRDLEPVSRSLAAKVRKIAEAISQTASHTRAVARGMNPVVASGDALMHALRRLAAETTRTHGRHCVFECPRSVLIDDTIVANQLYRIAQEAVHNAVRHSGAKRITVRLSESDAGTQLEVKDNGRGLPANAAAGVGVGLRGMTYRARLIQGQLAIQGRKRGGTEVVCRIPKSTPKR